jgi:uncharacterized membrane protein YdjX (TVP38/TMEM64 family)
MTRGVRICLGLLWVGLGLSFLVAWRYSGIPAAEVPRLLADWLHDVGMARAVLIFLVLYTVRPLVLFPSTILGLASGIMFGPWAGSAVTMAGELAGATLAFGVARVLGRGWVERHESERLARWDRRISGNGTLSVAVMRLILLPFDTVSYACGLTAIRLRDFLIGTVAGGSCYILAITFLGGSASTSLVGEVELFGFVLSQRALVLMLSGLSLLLGLVLAWRLRRRFRQPEQHMVVPDERS